MNLHRLVGCVKLIGLAIGFFALSTSALAQPATSDGEALFRGNCAFCHGTNARGGRGPSLLAASLNHGSADADLERVIKNGVKGSSMPDFDFEPEELSALVSYVQSLRKGTVVQAVIAGDAQLGQIIYERNRCASCHQIGVTGGVYGPDLTRVGSARSYDYLHESIVTPSADIADEYKGVTVIEKDGRPYTGIRINEDTFTIQLRLPDQQFRSFKKDSLRDVQYLSDSLMPGYHLKDTELQNLIAYLSTLRTPPAAKTQAPKQSGVH